MPLPLYTSEKPSTSETGHPDQPHDTKTTSESPNNSSSTLSQAAMDELARTNARRDSINSRHEAEGMAGGMGGHAQGQGQGHGQGNNTARREMTREEADRAYEEAMEEEYAKREGGA